MRKNPLSSLQFLTFFLVFGLTSAGVRSAINTITTISGTGTAGSTGTGGVATAMTINAPRGVWEDANGDIYVSEGTGQCVRAFSFPNGIVRGVAGICTSSGYTADNIQATSSKLNSPSSVGVDSAGAVYVGEYSGHRVRKVVNSIITTLAGTGTAGSTGDGAPVTSSTVNSPFYFSFDTNGVMFMASYGSSNIRKVNLNTNIIYLVGGTGTASFTGDGGPATSATFFNCRGVVVETNGNLFVGDFGSHRVRYINTNLIVGTTIGTGTTTYNGENVPASSANMNNPIGVSVDSSNGDIYVASYSNSRLHVLTRTNSLISTYAGTGSGTASGDYGAATAGGVNTDFLFLDTIARMFTSDYNNHRIRLIMYDAPTSQPSSQPSSRPTGQPTVQPSRQPTGQPTCSPSRQPSSQPTRQPSGQPSVQPSSQPSTQPFSRPSVRPSNQPSRRPSTQPSSHPTEQPSVQPSARPTIQPICQPTSQPSRQPSEQPTRRPSVQPSTQPSRQPFGRPSSRPSQQPTSQPSRQPSSRPTSQPSDQPSLQPTEQPSCQPSAHPTCQPSSQPSRQPTVQPASRPSSQPSARPSGQPTRRPSGQPTRRPSVQPSVQPSTQPAALPSSQPSVQPSSRPSTQPSMQPSHQPSGQPTCQPSGQPSYQPSAHPTCQPSSQPSRQPTVQPASRPSSQPSARPSGQPTRRPSGQPTRQPSVLPSSRPSRQPSSLPSTQLTYNPTRQPSVQPSMQPSSQPTSQPSGQPSLQPISHPSTQPSTLPSTRPSSQPFRRPSSQPSCLPSAEPSTQPAGNPSSRPSAHPILRPTGQPTFQPSSHPSGQPTVAPSNKPSGQPSSQPSFQPIGVPTTAPTTPPSARPSQQPTGQPSVSPSTSPSRIPTCQPSHQPSAEPTRQPTSQPSHQPSVWPSAQPTKQPVGHPSTLPTVQPGSQPSRQPSSHPTRQPTRQPTSRPSSQPQSLPTRQPSAHPSDEPSSLPSTQPSDSPSMRPTSRPSSQPSRQPLNQPSGQPTYLPSGNPSGRPSSLPSRQPSGRPSVQPTSQPTEQPSLIPLSLPTSKPSLRPSVTPSGYPSVQPTLRPSVQPMGHPSSVPSLQPFTRPTSWPSNQPTMQPSRQPTAHPSRHTAKPVVVSAVGASLPSDQPISVLGEWNRSFRIVIPQMSFNRSCGVAFSDIVLGNEAFGKSYVVHGSATLGASLDLSVGAVANLQIDHAKRSVSILPDVNGDSFDDLIIGDPMSSKCYILFGSEDGLVNMTSGFTIFGALEGDLTGWSVSGAGDVNNDTLQDIIIGAPNAKGSGAVYVIYGSVQRSNVHLSNLSAADGFVLFGELKSDYFGVSVSFAGDMNRDGFDDIVVGAVAVASYCAGAAYIVFGRSDFAVSNSMSRLTEGQVCKFSGDPYQYAGLSVSGAGDVNRDGHDDIIVGSSPTKADAVKISFIIYGSQSMPSMDLTALTESQGVVIVGGGSTVGYFGDNDQDGFSDVLVSDAVIPVGASVGLIVTHNVEAFKYPSVSPTAAPTSGGKVSRIPTVRPTLKPTRQPSEMSPSMELTQSPSTVSANSTYFSIEPTIRPTQEPSEAPTVKPTTEPSEIPTVRPSYRLTPAPSTWEPTTGTRSPNRKPTTAPTSAATDPPTLVRFVSKPWGFYNDTKSTKTVSYYVVNATGSVSIDPAPGKCIYSIEPGSNLTFTIIRFNVSSDVIDVSRFKNIVRYSDLVITAGSVIITLPTQQVVRILNQNPASMRAANFIFGVGDDKKNALAQGVLIVVRYFLPVSGALVGALICYRIYSLFRPKLVSKLPDKFLMTFDYDKQTGELILHGKEKINRLWDKDDSSCSSWQSSNGFIGSEASPASYWSVAPSIYDSINSEFYNSISYSDIDSSEETYNNNSNNCVFAIPIA